MKTRAISVVAILLGSVLAACQRTQPVPEPSTATYPPMTAPAAPAKGPLAATLQVEQLTDSLHFLLQVTNRTSDSIELTFPSGQSFDFAVLQDGRELWRWSADRMFTQAIRTEMLEAGATRTYEAGWRPPAGMRGRVTARAWLATSEPRAEQETEVELP